MNCSDDFPNTDVFYSEISGDVTLIVLLSLALVFGVAQLIIYIDEAWYIRTNHTDRNRISKVLTLLLLYPVVSVSAAVALLVPPASLLVDLLSACYLSICIHVFVCLVVDHFHDEDTMVSVLSDHVLKLNTRPFCCCCVCLPKGKLTRRKLDFLQLIVRQVAIVRPVLLFIAAVLWTDGKYNSGKISADSAEVYVSVLSIVSTFTAMYGLIVVYQNTRAHLPDHRLVVKFISLKVAVFCINIQSFFFNILASNGIPGCIGTSGSRVRSSNIHHGVLIIELFLLSLLARSGYRQPEVPRHPGSVTPCKLQHVENGIGTTAGGTDNPTSFENPLCTEENQQHTT